MFILLLLLITLLFFFFFFNDTATTEIYTLSLHDALPICFSLVKNPLHKGALRNMADALKPASIDRKSTRLNSSHLVISYAVFCLKKKKKIKILLYRLIENHIKYIYMRVLCHT